MVCHKGYINVPRVVQGLPINSPVLVRFITNTTVTHTMNAEQWRTQQQLNQTLEILEGLAQKAVLLNNGKHNSDLQKAIVGIIRGSEFAFEELTGVKYHTEDTIPN